jgi:hypothetical protein
MGKSTTLSVGKESNTVLASIRPDSELISKLLGRVE